MSQTVSPPIDLVLVGHVLDAQGIRGLVKVKPYSKEPEALFSAPIIWLAKPPASSELSRPFTVKTAKEHSGHILLGLDQVGDRDQALSLKGSAIYVSRADFPEQADGDSFYWVDLIGLPVKNQQGDALGLVTDLMDNGAQSILCIKPSDALTDKDERLIPFIKTVVQSVTVDKSSEKYGIVVDWQLDW
jgi:16S rRNA processing protein RimM